MCLVIEVHACHILLNPYQRLHIVTEMNDNRTFLVHLDQKRRDISHILRTQKINHKNHKNGHSQQIQVSSFWKSFLFSIPTS